MVVVLAAIHQEFPTRSRDQKPLIKGRLCSEHIACHPFIALLSIFVQMDPLAPNHLVGWTCAVFEDHHSGPSSLGDDVED